MSRVFTSFQELAQHLDGAVARLQEQRKGALEYIGQAVEDTARAKFGQYQPQTGPMPAWAPLALRTMLERVRLGFSPNDPHLRTGAVRDSSTHSVDGDTVSVGSPDPIAADLEYGDPRQNRPPRPTYGPAMYEMSDMAGQELLGAIIKALE